MTDGKNNGLCLISPVVSPFLKCSIFSQLKKLRKLCLVFFHLYKPEKENEKSFNYKLKGQKRVYQNIQAIWNFSSGLRLSTHLIPQRLLCSAARDSLKIIGLTYTFCTVEKISAYRYSFLYRKKLSSLGQMPLASWKSVTIFEAFYCFICCFLEKNVPKTDQM